MFIADQKAFDVNSYCMKSTNGQGLKDKFTANYFLRLRRGKFADYSRGNVEIFLAEL